MLSIDKGVFIVLQLILSIMNYVKPVSHYGTLLYHSKRKSNDGNV
jgi:hypothetical protein